MTRRVVDRDAAVRFRREARRRGETVVFTNGCFDLLHRGHVDLLRAARAFGDHLIVGLNADRSVRVLKGEGRPLQGEDDRAAILAALRPVDRVVIFPEDTPLELIRLLVPDVLVKGADYRPEDVVGAKEVVAAGGRVELIDLTPGRSTTRLAGGYPGRDDPSGG